MMLKKNLYKFIIIFILVLLLLSTANAATVIKADLQQHLKFSQQQDLVNIIIDFSDKIDIHHVKYKGKHNHRNLIRDARQKSKVSQKQLIQFLKRHNITDYTELWLTNSLAITVEAKLVSQIAGLVGIARIRYDKELTFNATTISVPGTAEWNIQAVNTPAVWSAGFTGQNTVIGIIGAGVDVYHPDLASRYRGGTNSWLDTTKLVGSDTPYDETGHGTAVMGIALGGNNSGVNIGMAPGATWIAAKIAQGANTRSSKIIQAFEWMMDPDGDPSTDDFPDVVNNSWNIGATNACDNTYQIYITALRDKGISVVFSAGNSGPAASTSFSPANNADVISVGAVDESLTISKFSSRGPGTKDCALGSTTANEIYPNIVAPGDGILTADLSLAGTHPNPYTFVSGTSFSAPHIAGALALLKSAFPKSTIDEREQAIKDSVKDLGFIGNDTDFGWGFLNIDGAYQLLLDSPNIVTTIPYVRNHSVSIIKDSVVELIPLLNNASADARFDTTNVIDKTSVTIVTQPTSGSLDIDPITGVASYTPLVGFIGTDSFSYRADDTITKTAQSNIGMVYIVIAEEVIPTAATPQGAAGGGGCTVQNNARFDPVFIVLLMLSMFYFNRFKQRK